MSGAIDTAGLLGPTGHNQPPCEERLRLLPSSGNTPNRASRKARTVREPRSAVLGLGAWRSAAARGRASQARGSWLPDGPREAGPRDLGWPMTPQTDFPKQPRSRTAVTATHQSSLTWCCRNHKTSGPTAARASRTQSHCERSPDSSVVRRKCTGLCFPERRSRSYHRVA
jgi:hypothetical protein